MLVADQSNQFLKGKDKYQKNMGSAKMMLKHNQPPVN